MDRRDFLLFRTGAKSRTVELSCEWLYMKWFDSQVTGQLSRQWVDSSESAGFDEHTTKELFEELDRQLRDADAVRVTKMQWLTGDLRREFGRLLRAFRARGGKVHIER